MRKLLYLKLDGDLVSGVRVTLTIEEDNQTNHAEITGNLPVNSNLSAVFGHNDEVNGIDFSSNGAQIATASDDKTIGLWNVDTKTLCQSNKNKQIHLGDNKRLREHEERVIGVKFNRDGNMIASTSFDNTVRLWNHYGKRTHIFQGQLGLER